MIWINLLNLVFYFATKMYIKYAPYLHYKNTNYALNILNFLMPWC